MIVEEIEKIELVHGTCVLTPSWILPGEREP